MDTQPQGSSLGLMNPSSSSSAIAGRRKKLPPFVSKLYTMVEDPTTNHIISWSAHDSFVVHRVEELTTDILPLYFKHCNFCSFIRQVNTYGFTKTNPDTWEFQNAFFVRGKEASRLFLSWTSFLNCFPSNKLLSFFLKMFSMTNNEFLVFYLFIFVFFFRCIPAVSHFFRVKKIEKAKFLTL